MRTTVTGLAVGLAVVLGPGPADAWHSANRFGGSTTHYAGVGTEHTNAWGGSTAHGWGGGTEHTNRDGGTTYGAAGAGAVHTTPYGESYYHPPIPGEVGYAPYHPPVVVPYYASGCPGCGAAVAAGAAAGVAAGAAVAIATTPRYAVGGVYVALPPAATLVHAGGATYYVAGNTWFRPGYGANGVFYTVVPAP